MRHDKILPIQPPNLKKTPFQQNRFFQDANSAMYFYQHAATRSHSSGRKWLQVAAPSEWPQVAAPSEWPQVAAKPQVVPEKLPVNPSWLMKNTINLTYPTSKLKRKQFFLQSNFFKILIFHTFLAPCSHLRPLAGSSHLRPLAAPRNH